MSKDLLLNPIVDGNVDPRLTDFLVSSRYATETLGDITLNQVENLKVWGLLPPGVKSHEMAIDVDARTVVYVLQLVKGKKLPETVIENWLKPLSKAAQLLLGETWEITWRRAKKLVYRQPRRRPLVPLDAPDPNAIPVMPKRVARLD